MRTQSTRAADVRSGIIIIAVEWQTANGPPVLCFTYLGFEIGIDGMEQQEGHLRGN